MNKWNLARTDVTDMFKDATAWLVESTLDESLKVIDIKVVDSNIHELVDKCLAEDMSGDCDGVMNLPMKDWDTSDVTDMSALFKNRRTFNVNISAWDVSSVTDFSEMFYGAEFFNYNLPWTTSSARNMDKMFFGASEFNGLIRGWDTSKVTSLQQMFYNAKRFTDDISDWNYNSVVDTSYTHFLTGADAFNARFECVRYYMRTSGRCTDDPGGEYLRQNECLTAYAAQDPKPWSYRWSWWYGGDRGWKRRNTVSRFWSHRSGWSPPGCWHYPWGNYMLYNRYTWSRRSCSWYRRCFCKDPFGVTPSTCKKRYTTVPAIEQFELRKSVDDCLAEAPEDGECTNWATISGLGTMPNWDVSKIKDMSRLFKGRREFNVNIQNWDTSNVDNMQEMFMDAVEFSRDISGWTFKSNVNKKDMFKNAKRFFLDCEETKCFRFFKQ